jgi:hypothetical protein
LFLLAIVKNRVITMVMQITPSRAVAQVVEPLPSKSEALSSNFSTTKKKKEKNPALNWAGCCIAVISATWPT